MPSGVEGVDSLTSARLTARPNILIATREAVAARARAIQADPLQVPFFEFPPTSHPAEGRGFRACVKTLPSLSFRSRRRGRGISL